MASKKKQLTFEERMTIERFRALRLTYRAMARAMGRPVPTIHSEIARNEKPYNAQKAQDRANAEQLKKGNRLSAHGLRKGRKANLTQQIKNLQEQIDILFDIIKEIQGNGKH